jgi:transcription factor SPN1
MDNAAKEDLVSIKLRKPALKKLQMLPEVIDMITKREMIRPVLEFNFLAVASDWIKPLPNGTLGNVTVRQRLLSSIANMTGEQGIGPDDLKKSGFGKVVMSLYMHKSETPAMKRQLKNLIEQWSRPIFKKSGNLRDLERTSAYRGETGITGFARAQSIARNNANAMESSKSNTRGRNEKDLTSIISSRTSKSMDLGNNRVRVPYSKGFQFTVRPADRTGDVMDKRTRVGSVKENRDALHKRMMEKTRPAQKNQRSANISIEGRPTK